jgi:hypothetical protein
MYTKEEIIKEIERLNKMEEQYPLSQYLEWYRDYLYEKLSEVSDEGVS